MPALTTTAIVGAAIAGIGVVSQYDQGQKRAHNAQVEADRQAELKKKQMLAQQEAAAQQENRDQTMMEQELGDDTSGPTLQTAANASNRKTRMRRDTLTPKGLSVPSQGGSGINLGYDRTV